MALRLAFIESSRCCPAFRPYANIAGIPAFIELRDAYVSGEILNDESKATVR